MYTKIGIRTKIILIGVLNFIVINWPENVNDYFIRFVIDILFDLCFGVLYYFKRFTVVNCVPFA